MNSKIYRCGYCGMPTCSNGKSLDEKKHNKAVSIINRYLSEKANKHYPLLVGECCEDWAREN